MDNPIVDKGESSPKKDVLKAEQATTEEEPVVEIVDVSVEAEKDPEAGKVDPIIDDYYQGNPFFMKWLIFLVWNNVTTMLRPQNCLLLLII